MSQSFDLTNESLGLLEPVGYFGSAQSLRTHVENPTFHGSQMAVPLRPGARDFGPGDHTGYELRAPSELGRNLGDIVTLPVKVENTSFEGPKL